MTDYVVARTAEISEGERIVTQLEGREICVFNIDGEYRAYTNWCPHQAGPVCEGAITGTAEATFDRESLETTLCYTKEGQILNCPWHGWEYDITTGECLSRQQAKPPEYSVTVQDGDIIVSV